MRDISSVISGGRCLLCSNNRVSQLLDLGMQPICNRFLTAPSDDEYLHGMVFGFCKDCGVVQLIDPVPANELMPRVDWISYNEPEAHLDQLARDVRDLTGITDNSTICGITFKDDSLLARMEGLGSNTWRIDPSQDLAITEAGVGVETIQARLTLETAARIAEERGPADVVIVRHILEHAHDTASFIEAVKNLVKPNGYIVFEVPDCTKSLESCDYSCPWEEHVLYFTPETLKRGLAMGEMSMVSYASYPYSLEDSLVAIVRPATKSQPVESVGPVTPEEQGRIANYAAALNQHQEKFQSYLSHYRNDNGKIALLGAGHLACTFINLLGLKEHIEFIVDDNPQKRGLFLPGSGLPIVGSDALISEDIKLCLLSVHPQAEDRVIENNQGFTEHGGAFASMFPRSKLALSA